ncbi:hypothetical protein TWF694_005233 [Orbilia ellipsospora]|uniref:Nucleoside phosphorylase domain-containing protein n=1 Tax=Orbilia ellipsospora TaxID=2528407 RepID=A0AAV9WV89_9PEZI
MILEAITPSEHLQPWYREVSIQSGGYALFILKWQPRKHDEIHAPPPDLPGDNNSYILGSVGSHNIVIACLPSGSYGTTRATITASHMITRFPSLRYYLMVGIGGGVPQRTADIRLGDVVVSTPAGSLPGVVQYDFGKTLPDGRFQTIGVLDKPPTSLLNAVNKLRADHRLQRSKIATFISDVAQKYPGAGSRFAYPRKAQDQLFEANYDHSHGDTCQSCDTNRLVFRTPRTTSDLIIHYGVIASGNQVMKCGLRRDMVAKDFGVYCFEMEAAGLMDAFPCLVIRGICDYSDSHKNMGWQDYAAITAAAYAKELLLDAVPATQVETGKLPQSQADKIKELLLQSLSFMEIDNRKHNISKILHDTCDWLFETTEFQKWQQRDSIGQHNGVLWIKGKPGTGKSTLMKHAFRYCENLFREYFIPAYFFNARGSGLERSAEGMLRSLIYQFLDNASDISDRFISLFSNKQRKYRSERWPWSFGELTELLCELVTQTCQPIFIFVDALDECDEEEVRNVMTYLEDLSITTMASGISLNICLSSRHYPTITMRKHLELVMGLQQSHNRDISIYVKRKIKMNDISIELAICRRAEGIFMWVVLVVELINRVYDEGDIIAVRKKLEEIPSGLDEIFLTLLVKDNPRKQETVLMFQWVLFARKLLAPEELYYAVVAGTSPDSLGKWDDSAGMRMVVWRFITNISKGLLEIRGSSNFYVQFIHETVRDFLLRNKRLQTLDATLEPDIIGTSHERLANCCLSLFAIKCLRESLAHHEGSPYSDIDKPRAQTYPLLYYASHEVFKHAKCARERNICLRNFFERLCAHPGLIENLNITRIWELFRTPQQPKEKSKNL